MTREELTKQIADLEAQLAQHLMLYHTTNGALGFARYLLKQDEESAGIKETPDEVHKV